MTRIIWQRNSTDHFSFQASVKANLARCPAAPVYMRERGLWPAKKIAGFSTLPSPRAEVGLLCEGDRSPSQRLHPAAVSGKLSAALLFLYFSGGR
ncbi:hypothetical protein, partial [Phaeovulum sp.]|uniref:hypothetical protein n=1 Tax=Phaeovulum sp. TaxID=2934796 RepID=UPI0039E60F6F